MRVKSPRLLFNLDVSLRLTIEILLTLELDLLEYLICNLLPTLFQVLLVHIASLLVSLIGIWNHLLARHGRPAAVSTTLLTSLHIQELAILALFSYFLLLCLHIHLVKSSRNEAIANPICGAGSLTMQWLSYWWLRNISWRSG